MVVNDDWLRAAMTDDAVVVELLVRLKHSRSSLKVGPVSSSAAAELPPPRWGIRQPRTRLAFRGETTSPVKGGGDLRRNSPTTPLSWSAGAASSSGTADGCEDSDLPPCGSYRSKVIASNDSTCSLNNKLKRKKTFAELKEEENLLLKERVHLNKELANLNATFMDEWTRNENLKRMKLLQLEFNPHTSKSMVRPFDERLCKANHRPQGHIIVSPIKHESAAVLPPQVGTGKSAPSDASREPDPGKKEDASFVLPDLNLTPCEEEFCW